MNFHLQQKRNLEKRLARNVEIIKYQFARTGVFESSIHESEKQCFSDFVEYFSMKYKGVSTHNQVALYYDIQCNVMQFKAYCQKCWAKTEPTLDGFLEYVKTSVFEDEWWEE